MRKLILCGTALLFSLSFANAQGWSATGVHDDFATTTPYANGPNGEGVNWWENTGGDTLVITRNTGSMSIAVTTAGGCHQDPSPAPIDPYVGRCYPILGLDFGTSNTVDLSGGANITFDIENTNTNDDTYISIVLEDINGNQSKVEPNVSDVLSTFAWGDAPYPRKGLNGFTIPAGQRVTVTIDLSSVPGAIGGLTAGAYTCDIPANCPVTSYTIDPTKIKDVLFLVNFGKDNIFLSEGDGDYTVDTFIDGTTITPFTGTLNIYDFTLGTFSTTGLNKTMIDNSLSIYPSPADETLNVSFKAAAGADVTLSDIVGSTVLSASANAGDNKITMNTSNLSSGIYILNVTTENGKVTRKVVVE
jgi:Secretion system C-terminal sorting domain